MKKLIIILIIVVLFVAAAGIYISSPSITGMAVQEPEVKIEESVLDIEPSVQFSEET